MKPNYTRIAAQDRAARHHHAARARRSADRHRPRARSLRAVLALFWRRQLDACELRLPVLAMLRGRSRGVRL